MKTFGFIQYWLVMPLAAFFLSIISGTVDNPVSWLLLGIGMASLWGLYLYGAVAYIWTAQYRDAISKLEAEEEQVE